MQPGDTPFCAAVILEDADEGFRYVIRTNGSAADTAAHTKDPGDEGAYYGSARRGASEHATTATGV